MAGISRLVGWPDRDPVGMGVNYPDYVSALWGTVAVVCALIQREHTGEGCEIDVSQYQVALSCLGPTVMEAVLGGSGLGSLGNRRPGRAPHGVYPCRGPDQWVAISVLDETMWHGLCTARGARGSWQRTPASLTLAGRVAHQDELDDDLAGWSERLTALGGSVGAAGRRRAPPLPWSRTGRSLLDTQLDARDFFRVLPHARFGAELSYGQAIVLSETAARFTRAAPAFGEDTGDILRDVAGCTDEEVRVGARDPAWPTR